MNDADILRTEDTGTKTILYAENKYFLCTYRGWNQMTQQHSYFIDGYVHPQDNLESFMDEKEIKEILGDDFRN